MRVCCTIPGKPMPCPRPRVDRGGVHYSDAYTNWMIAAKVLLRDACVKQNGGRLYTTPVVVNVIFANARKNADIDNLSKSVLDALQGTVIEDDKQVHLLVASKDRRMETETIVFVRPSRR